MTIRFVLLVTLLAGSTASLFAQDLTISPYSRYGIGDIVSSTTTRNAAMGGLSVATDNYYSINRVNPASYGDLYFTTMDISAFWQASQLRTTAGEGTRYTAGIQNAAFAFPSNKNLILTMGFGPYSSVGYDISARKNVVIADSSLIEETTYAGSGGLNQAFIGAAVRVFDNKLRLGVNGQYNFGNTRYSWTSLLFRSDSVQATGFLPLSTTEDVYLKGWMVTAGFIYEDTLNAAKYTTFRIGGMIDWTPGLSGDRLTQVSNGLVRDTLGELTLGTVALPTRFGLGLMVGRFGHWSVGADVQYQDWQQFSYFGEDNDLGRELKIAVGGELTPNQQSLKYLARIDYRMGAYLKQTYLQFNGEAVNDYGVTFGVGLPADAKGNSRFNRGRAVSRINISAELGQRGSLSTGQPLEELYARIRIGATINDRWFVRRVID